MFYLKKIAEFIRTKGALAGILLVTTLIFILLVQKGDLAFINHQTENGFDELLTVVIGVLATVIVTTFSAIIVSLQLASAQFSPRILRGFFSENGKVQLFLMSFFLCISYCLTIKYLGLVHPNDKFIFLNYEFHFASIGILSAIILLLAVFPVFIYYIIKNINVAYIIQNIANRTISVINLSYKKEWNYGQLDNYKQSLPSDYSSYLKIRTNQNGFFESLNPLFIRVLKLFGLNIYLTAYVGSFVSKGSKIAYVSYQGNNRLAINIITKLVVASVKLDSFRSYTQDIHFGIRQLVDIAIKAISPAINDPTTAVNALNYIGEVVKAYTVCIVPSQNAVELQKTNVHLNESDFDKLVDLSFDQIYFWGKYDYIIVKHIIDTITDIIKLNKNPHNLSVLIKQIIDKELFEKTDAELKEMYSLNEYAKSVKKSLLRFSEKSISKIDEAILKIDNLKNNIIYNESKQTLLTQKNILVNWHNKQL